MPSSQPLVTIVIPAYNHAHYIEETLNSVLAQTYVHLDIVIINDGSTDETGAICQDFAQKDPRIRYLEQKNQGAHITINTGIEMAKGRYVTVLNSDDRLFPERIERCLQIVTDNPSIQLVTGSVQLIGDRGEILTDGFAMDWLNRAFQYLSKTNNYPLSLMNENFIATTSNMFFAKSLWRQNSGFQPLRYCHDLDFLMTSYRTASCFYDKECKHIDYRVHSGNTIQEDVRPIRVEIAAVIAVALVSFHTGLLKDHSHESLTYFKEFLHNKNITPLITWFMMRYISCMDRCAFYQTLYQERPHNQYMALLD